MKRLLIVIDGMDDEPAVEMGNLSPASYASMPSLSYMRAHGEVSVRRTIPEGCPASTEVALMTILGFGIKPHSNARSWFEALGGGVPVKDTDLCLRCNLITHENGIIVSHCGHYPDSGESQRAAELLNQCFGGNDFQFHSFGDFRNLLVIHNCTSSVEAREPHALIGQPVGNLSVKSDDWILEKRLNSCISGARSVLSNRKANGIALWAPGTPVSFPHKVKGSVVAGVNVVKGIGRAAGMTVIDVPGATGDEFTDFSAKLSAALGALEKDEFVMLHIEAADEASHERAPFKKAEILEKIDRLVLSPLLAGGAEGVRITVQADHATSSVSGKHLNCPVEVIDYNKTE